MELGGAVALVTGAEGGLGGHWVAGLLARGARRVHATALEPERLAGIAAAAGGRVAVHRLDVTDPGAVARAAAEAGDVTLLVNNAGLLAQRGLMEAGELGPLRAEMEVNLFGLAAMCLAFAPVIAANGGGAIVNMLSVASLLPFSPFGSYAASKAAAMSLTQSLRHELAPRGIRVVGVYAGFIDTPMTAGLGVEKAAPAGIVARALDGLAAGQADIATDARSERALARLGGDLEAVLARVHAEAEAFRAAHPLPPRE